MLYSTGQEAYLWTEFKVSDHSCQCLSIDITLTSISALLDSVVVQVLLIFRPKYNRADQSSTIPLVYVEFLAPCAGSLDRLSEPFELDGDTITHQHLPEANIDMYKVQRAHRADGTRIAEIMDLSQLWRPVELIPFMGESCDKTWTCETSTELAEELWVNCFHGKEDFQVLY